MPLKNYYLHKQTILFTSTNFMNSHIPPDAHAIIIGAMKCGTSSLYNYLIKHPEICPAKTKETEFFSENQRHGLQVKNYNDLWSFNDATHKYTLEASTGYTKYPLESNVPKMIHDYGIKPKFIYIVRNPFDRVVSHFNFIDQKNRSWNLSITENQLIQTSNYFLQLEQYRKYFSIKDILILDFDELKSDPDQLLLKVYKFLNISNNQLPKQYGVSNRTKVESRLQRGLRKSKIGPIFEYVPAPLNRLGKKIIHTISPPPEKRTLNKDEKEFIYNELKENMAEFHRVYGFDVSKWGFEIP